MSGQQRLPVEVDPYRMAERGRLFSGQIKIRQLKRLVPLLEADSGEIDVELGFDIDETGIRYLQGQLKAQLVMRCQRCMDLMDFPLETGFRLALIQTDTEAERLPGIYEPLVVDDTPLRLADVIEDEMLLAIPQIPMHDEDECEAQITVNETELEEQQEEGDVKENPFAVLEKLKKDY